MLRKANELALSVFERKIYGPVYKRVEWQIRYNYELYQLCKTPSIRVTKFTRLQWAGHFQRMSDNEMPRRIKCRPEGSRMSVGWPRL
jgi:hypothetical protein